MKWWKRRESPEVTERRRLMKLVSQLDTSDPEVKRNARETLARLTPAEAKALLSSTEILFAPTRSVAPLTYCAGYVLAGGLIDLLWTYVFHRPLRVIMILEYPLIGLFGLRTLRGRALKISSLARTVDEVWLISPLALQLQLKPFIADPCAKRQTCAYSLTSPVGEVIGACAHSPRA